MPERTEPRPAIERLRRRKEQHKQRSRVYRVSFGILGALVIMLGLLLSLPGIPGPGLLLVVVGLTMLALEFDRAERLLERALDQLEGMRERTKRAGVWQKALMAGLVTAAVLAAVAAVRVWEIPLVPG